MTIDQNTLRRLNKLWKDRHGHSTDTTAAELVEIRETISVGSSGAAVSPAFIHLSNNAGQTIAIAGEAISWDTQHPLIDPVGFANPADTGTDNLPVTTVIVPYDGYYGVKVELKWDSHTSGGTVEIRRTRNSNAVRLWPTADDPGIWTATDGQIFADMAIVPAVVGDLLSVYLDHDDGAATKDLDTAQVIFYKVESSTVVRPLYRAAVLAAGPAGYWRFDESSGTTAADETGNNDGTYVGTPVFSELGVMRDGSGSPSVEFDGSTEWVTVPQAAVDGLTDLTVEAWVDKDATSRYGVFNVNYSGGNSYNRWGLWVYDDDTLYWHDGAAVTAYASTGTLSNNTRHYIVATRSAAGVLLFYIDGVLDTTHTGIDVSASSSGDTVQIGMDIDSGAPDTDEFDGHMDEIAVYGRVLDPDEILEHYNIGREAFL